MFFLSLIKLMSFQFHGTTKMPQKSNIKNLIQQTQQKQAALCRPIATRQTFNELAHAPWAANDELHAVVEAARERIITRALSGVCRRLGKRGARLAERKHTRRRLIKECASKYGRTDTHEDYGANC
jgi:hypothetical protein